MDFTREEANIVYEDRTMDLESSIHLEGSDDEENHQELEEMLYSQVYFDNSSIGEAPKEQTSSPNISVNVTTIGAVTPKSKSFISAGVNETSSNSKGPQFVQGCSRSEFNHPTRTSVTRYYDVNQDESNANPIFVAPSSPSQKRNSKNVAKKKVLNPLSTKLLARSVNEQSYLPSLPQRNSAVSKGTSEVGKDKDPVCNSSLPQNASPRTEQIMETLSTGTGKQSLICPPEIISLPKEKESATDVSELPKNLNQSTPVTSKKSKLPSFESKVSKVLSSMLDDESRSSLDENPSATICTNQSLMSELGWSVGMSWADMSSKYSFEVDSIEEESVSSLQLQESCSNTRVTQTRVENNGDEEEPSRYDLSLKSKDKARESKPSERSETDSESEVGSIVEVAPPVRPAPLLVDISDGEYAPVNESKNTPPVSASSEIIVLLSKPKDSAAIPRNIIDISSDDDLMILEVVDPSKPKNLSAHRGQKRHSVQTEEKMKLEESVPPKRLPYQKDKNCEVAREKDELSKQIQTLSNTPPSEISKVKKRNRLERWLHNPIKASKYLDHDKDLKKMSDDPRLWQLCWADKNLTQTPRGPKCTNCNQFGHKTHTCRVPRKIVVCHMCGMPGHSETRCPQKMCLKCGTKNNIFTDRCKQCSTNSTLCQICNSRAHGWKTCPDLWRRYHLTTSQGDLTKHIGVDIRQRSEQWCSNCASNGHLSHECQMSHWKCESISPFIKSYAAVSAEEEKCVGVNNYAMLLSTDAAKLLDSNEGKDFLKCLSVASKVTIFASFDIAFKKLVMAGTTLALEEVRSQVKDWIAAQTVSKTLPKVATVAPRQKTVAQTGTSGDKTQPKEASTSTEELSFSRNPPNVASPVGEIPAQMIRKSAWESPPVLPESYDELADIIDKELEIVGVPRICTETVQQLYDKLCAIPTDNTAMKKKLRKQYARMLSIILIGQCGFHDGAQHVEALKGLVVRLRKRRGYIRGLHNLVVRHHTPIFGGIVRPDFQKLVNEFYSKDSFVKQFDGKERQGEVNPPLSKETDLVPTEISRSQNSSVSYGTRMTRQRTREFDRLPIQLGKASINPKRQANTARKDPRDNSMNNFMLDAVEKQVKQAVPTVIKNLSSRFIFTKDRASLERMHKLLCKNLAQGTRRQDLLQEMKGVIDKLCRSYDIKLA